MSKKTIISSGGEPVIIRNAKRHRNTNIAAKQYISEHERLGIDPVVRNYSKDDFRMYNNTKKRNAAGFVHTGQIPSFIESESENERNVLYDDRPESSLYMKEFSSNDKKEQYIDENIEDDIFEQDDEKDESSQDKLADINVGDYVLFYKNDIIYSGSQEDVQRAIEDLLIDNENTAIYKNLYVLKFMKINTGVFINDKS